MTLTVNKIQVLSSRLNYTNYLELGLNFTRPRGICAVRFTGELVWFLCLRHALMSFCRNHSQKCVYSLGQHLFKMYFKTK